MKNIFKFIFASVLVLGLASCDEKMNMDLDIPGDVTLTDVQYTSSAQQGNVTLFTVSLTGEAGKAAIVFAAEGWQLPAGTYTASADAVAAGNYVVGRTSVNGFLVESGNIVVTEGGIEGNVVCEGTNVHFKWSGSLTWEKPVEPVALKTVLSAQSNVANGTKSLTLKFAQEGIASTYVQDATGQYVETWTGEGNYLSLDVYSADGLLYEGIYNANKEGGKIAAGEFGIGYDTVFIQDYSQWGGPIIETPVFNWGSCWWTVKDGAATAQKITSGTLTVIQVDEKNFEITLEGVAGEGETATEVYAQFTGDLAKFAPEIEEEEDDTPFDYGDYAPLHFIKMTDYAQYGMNMIGLELATEGVTGEDAGWWVTYAGTGNVLKLEVYAEGGALAEGTYTASTGELAAGKFNPGYENTDGNHYGSCWYNITNGTQTLNKYVTDGTVTVAKKGGKYIITVESGDIHAQFYGKLK